jgi:hypothetical protein
MKNSQKGFAPIVGLLIIAIVIIGGVYTVLKQRNTLSNSETTNDKKTVIDPEYGQLAMDIACSETNHLKIYGEPHANEAGFSTVDSHILYNDKELIQDMYPALVSYREAKNGSITYFDIDENKIFDRAYFYLYMPPQQFTFDEYKSLSDCILRHNTEIRTTLDSTTVKNKILGTDFSGSFNEKEVGVLVYDSKPENSKYTCNELKKYYLSLNKDYYTEDTLKNYIELQVNGVVIGLAGNADGVTYNDIYILDKNLILENSNALAAYKMCKNKDGQTLGEQFKFQY